MSRNVAIIGATSAIAQAVARNFANAGDRLVIVARDQEKMDAVAQDLAARGAASVDRIVWDLSILADLPDLVSKVTTLVKNLDVVLLAHGVLGDQQQAEKDWSYAEMLLRVNFLSVAALLTSFANYFQAQGSGSIAVISSVAGDRGRASNYVYGAAKAATTAWTSGLRGRLARHGVHVLTVNPGFVVSPMTAHLRRGPLFVEAGPVGDAIFRAIEQKTDIAYVPRFWWLIMFVIRHVPEFVFKRLRF